MEGLSAFIITIIAILLSWYPLLIIILHTRNAKYGKSKYSTPKPEKKEHYFINIRKRFLQICIYSEQIELSERISWHDDQLDFDPETLNGLKYIGGVDLSFPENDFEHALACLSILSWPSLKVNSIIIKKIQIYIYTRT